jgi:hypothetical protein
MVRAPDPQAFARHKDWLSTRKDSEPVKKARNKAQTALVAEPVLSYLPALDFDPVALRHFEREHAGIGTADLEGRGRYPLARI